VTKRIALHRRSDGGSRPASRARPHGPNLSEFRGGYTLVESEVLNDSAGDEIVSQLTQDARATSLGTRSICDSGATGARTGGQVMRTRSGLDEPSRGVPRGTHPVSRLARGLAVGSMGVATLTAAAAASAATITVDASSSPRGNPRFWGPPRRNRHCGATIQVDARDRGLSAAAHVEGQGTVSRTPPRTHLQRATRETRTSTSASF
jgi:hypothetical protein